MLFFPFLSKENFAGMTKSKWGQVGDWRKKWFFSLSTNDLQRNHAKLSKKEGWL